MIALWLSALGLAVGAGMGMAGLLNPRWAANLVRLQEAKAGAVAEFRGTYGGLFLGAHALALTLMVPAALGMEALGGVPTHWTALGAAGGCAAMWIGTGVGRIVSIVADKAGTPFNQASVAFEFGLGLVIAAPWLAAIG